jgi:UDPglucose 6-dehydrogenase
MPKILIVGHGFVGKAVDYGFSHPQVEKTIVDPKYGTNLDSIDISLFDIAFVCVPTPMGNDGAVDSSIIDTVLDRLTKYNITTVVKSTVTPDIVTNWPINVVYNPEFLTENAAMEQFVSPPFHILGGWPDATKYVEKVYEEYSLCNPCPSLHMTLEEASFVKYTINSFLAMKVLFFNQLYDAVKESNANFATIVKAVGMDNRIGSSHTKVPGFDGKQGYGGACFPKDTSAFTKFSDKLTLLEKCIIINNDYRSQYELDNREIEQHVNYGQTKKELQDQIDGYPV